jgi:hypothetical protein
MANKTQYQALTCRAFNPSWFTQSQPTVEAAPPVRGLGFSDDSVFCRLLAISTPFRIFGKLEFFVVSHSGIQAFEPAWFNHDLHTWFNCCRSRGFPFLDSKFRLFIFGAVCFRHSNGCA